MYTVYYMSWDKNQFLCGRNDAKFMIILVVFRIFWCEFWVSGFIFENKIFVAF